MSEKNEIPDEVQRLIDFVGRDEASMTMLLELLDAIISARKDGQTEESATSTKYRLTS